MAVTPKPKRERVGDPISFRFPVDVVVQLRALTALGGEPQVRIVERMIRAEYADTKAKTPEALAKVEKPIAAKLAAEKKADEAAGARTSSRSTKLKKK